MTPLRYIKSQCLFNSCNSWSRLGSCLLTPQTAPEAAPRPVSGGSRGKGQRVVVAGARGLSRCFTSCWNVGLNDLSFSDRNRDFRQRDLVIAKVAVSSVFLTDPRSDVNYFTRGLHAAALPSCQPIRSIMQLVDRSR